MNPKIRIDGKKTGFSSVCFILAYICSGRDDLTVQVSIVDPVKIYKIQCTDTTSYQCFGSVSSDSSQSEYGNSAVLQNFQCVCSGYEFSP